MNFSIGCPPLHFPDHIGGINRHAGTCPTADGADNINRHPGNIVIRRCCARPCHQRAERIFNVVGIGWGSQGGPERQPPLGRGGSCSRVHSSHPGEIIVPPDPEERIVLPHGIVQQVAVGIANRQVMIRPAQVFRAGNGIVGINQQELNGVWIDIRILLQILLIGLIDLDSHFAAGRSQTNDDCRTCGHEIPPLNGKIRNGYLFSSSSIHFNSSLHWRFLCITVIGWLVVHSYQVPSSTF